MYFNGYNKEVFDEDLRKFTNLRSLKICGTSLKVVKLKGNLSSKIEFLVLSYDLEAFPEYDPCLQNLYLLSCSGNFHEIPSWIESLQYLENFSLKSNSLKNINLDLCKMESLRTFDISESELYKKEMMYFNKYKKYNQLAKFKECKPDLDFKYRPRCY